MGLNYECNTRIVAFCTPEGENMAHNSNTMFTRGLPDVYVHPQPSGFRCTYQANYLCPCMVYYNIELFVHKPKKS